jgi:hypothetical protein
MLFDRKGGRSAVGWLLEELIGREQFGEYRTNERYSYDAIVLLNEVTGAKTDAAFLRDVNRINDCNNFGSNNPLGYLTAFAMLPYLLNNHRQYFESFSCRVDATLEKIENIMQPAKSEDGGARIMNYGARLFGTRLMEQPLSAYLEGETCALRTLTPIMVWN